jgi:hypothetical protein
MYEGKHAAQSVEADILLARSDQLQRIIPVVPTDWAMGYNAALWDIAEDLGLQPQPGQRG